MLTFPTSSAELACKNKTKREERSMDDEEEEGCVSGGVSLVPQPSLYYSLPVECDRLPFIAAKHDRVTDRMAALHHNSGNLNCNDPYDYEDI